MPEPRLQHRPFQHPYVVLVDYGALKAAALKTLGYPNGAGAAKAKPPTVFAGRGLGACELLGRADRKRAELEFVERGTAIESGDVEREPCEPDRLIDTHAALDGAVAEEIRVDTPAI